jgi:hypothetical protein
LGKDMPGKSLWRIPALGRILSGLLAGLNQLLTLSDFSRGDVFRD